MLHISVFRFLGFFTYWGIILQLLYISLSAGGTIAEMIHYNKLHETKLTIETDASVMINDNKQ